MDRLSGGHENFKRLLRLPTGSAVGWVDGDAAILPVRERNWLRIGGGFSIDGEVLREIVELRLKEIVFDARDRVERWRVSVEAFCRRARRFDFGHGPKFCAPASIYERERPL